MKKKGFIASGCLLGAALLALTGCGPAAGKNPGSTATGTKIYIYTGGASEFTWNKGSDEDRIINYIEDKYYQASGVKLDFQISYLGEDMKTKLSTEYLGGGQIDVAVSYNRGNYNGIDEYCVRHKLYKDLSEYLIAEEGEEPDYPNLLAAIDTPFSSNLVSTPLDSMTMSDGKVVGIPSVINPYKFGILVRKDYMERCGYTDEAAKAGTPCSYTGGNYVLVDNLETFGAMCAAMNSLGTDVKPQNTFAVSGAVWDVEKVMVGAYAHVSYFSNGYIDADEDGTEESILYGGAAPEFGGVLDLENRWAKTGVISKDNNNISLETAEANFISGKTGVFIQDPTVQHLITVARRTKAEHPEAEFTVFGALKATPSSPADKRGFMRNSEATFGAVIIDKSRNTRKILGFLDWVYSSAENYNLCRYGIEGEHWVNNGDGTYSFPAGKESYLTAPAYSGILTLVENQNVSNLRYSGYSAQEKHWIDDIANDKSNYVENEVVDYLFSNSAQINTLRDSAFVKINDPAKYSWVGDGDGVYAPLGIKEGTTTYFASWAAEYIHLMKGGNASGVNITQIWTNEFLRMRADRIAKAELRNHG